MKIVPSIMITAWVVVSSLLAYKSAYWIAEKYFFDSLIYYKQPSYGYWVRGKTDTLEDFGARSRDVLPYLSSEPDQKHNNSSSSAVLGVFDHDEYTIAVIGDSYVWGQGVRFDTSLTRLLEGKLNRKQKTRVLSLALQGDDIVDHVSKYHDTLEQTHVDLYIFVLGTNDILINPPRSRPYLQDAHNELIGLCQTSSEKVVTSPSGRELDVRFENLYATREEDAYKSPVNQCIYKKAIQLLPTNRAIYFLSDDYYSSDSDHRYEFIKNILKENNKYVVDVRKGQELAEYKEFWSDSNKYFWISSKEIHPSVLAHRMYADILYEEILSHPTWGFPI